MADVTLTIEGSGETRRVLVTLADGLALLGRARVVIGTNLRYAPFVHEGTAAHDIYPRDAKALFWKSARHPVRRVHHPGYAGNPFLVDGVLATLDTVAGIVMTGVQQITEGASANAMRDALAKIGFAAQGQAQLRANVETGTLRRSITSAVLT